MAVDNVTTQSTTGIDGNSYTSAVSNDTLTNADFLTLMLEEMKQQDPTKPMDSAALMDSQLQMSTIQANQDMATAMLSMQSSYAASALSTAANMIGHVVEDGNIDDTGVTKEYKVKTVENDDGVLYLNANLVTGIKDSLQNNDTDKYVLYDQSTGKIIEDGEETIYSVSLDAHGRFKANEDGSLKLRDADGNVVTDEAIVKRYTVGSPYYTYAKETTKMPLDSVVSVQ